MQCHVCERPYVHTIRGKQIMHKCKCHQMLCNSSGVIEVALHLHVFDGEDPCKQAGSMQYSLHVLDFIVYMQCTTALKVAA